MALRMTFEDLYFNENSGVSTYQNTTTVSNRKRIASHWGQRKLLFSEILFFTRFWDPKIVPNPVCVYVGAAYGLHIPLLSSMFPAIKFELYDSSPFIIDETDKIKIHRRLFTNKDVKKYTNRNDVFFISDIRCVGGASYLRKRYQENGFNVFDSKGMGTDGDPVVISKIYQDITKEIEDCVIKDMNTQDDWVIEINPVSAMLKFRLPYVFNADQDIVVQHLQGYIFKQIWQSFNSSEHRLVPVKENGKYIKKNWSSLEYDQLNYYHNTVEREQNRYLNPFTENADPIDTPELTNKFDEVAEVLILIDYMKKFDVKDVEYEVKRLSKTITWFLNTKYLSKPRKEKTLALLREPIEEKQEIQPDAFRKKTLVRRRRKITS